MANLPTTTTPASRPDSELEPLVALVAKLALAASEATRLAVEVQAKLPLALAKQASSTTWIRGVPKTPLQMETAFQDVGGELWYVVIRGREPGLYRTPDEANAQTDGVPHQFREKRKTRREALAFYRESYAAGIAYDNLVGAATATGANPPPAVNMGVQKWVAVPVSAVAPTASQ
ncbi:hypothetical protein MSAN_02287400 [Mycena sanguinolenta]|uniref:Ribonuclease H1 N-terminal domain-containing protein n=1 Tax=Mycena sanguinolenta TaxID=230812 RepID=A0A8H7CHW1_9AGAR|nr:hypothetical protein MSAN_02287400 [Mycena sanguinolenta]